MQRRARPTEPGEGAIPPLSDEDFARFRELVRSVAGINLTPAKKSLLVGRLTRRLRANGLVRFDEYYRLVRQDAVELQHMVDVISTNETHFFREPSQFEFLARRAVPCWRDEAQAGRRAQRLRFWSAACSTGEEPYSLAMVLFDHLPPESGWDLEILASDLSSRVLARACEAVWPIARSHEIPEAYLRRYMLRGTRSEEGRMCAGAAIAGVVRFAAVNLIDRSYAVGPAFDAIFCRNVLIYFDAETKKRVIERLLSHLAPGGLLFLGRAESLTGSELPVRAVGPSVYVRADAASSIWESAAPPRTPARAIPEPAATQLPDGARPRRRRRFPTRDGGRRWGGSGF